jgi:Putative DNA-binding domain
MSDSEGALGRPVFTPLHRWLGREAEPLSFELLDAAVADGLTEHADLDFKLSPPTSGALMQSDLAKDIAAMANSGGGMLLFGVRDSESRAREAPGVSPEFVLDTYVRDLRRVGINRISPPVLDLSVLTFGDDGDRLGLALVVPATEDAPHLIFNNDAFKAPYRNGPDTAWMNERMLEAAYRARFEAKRSATASLNDLMAAAVEGRSFSDRAWMVAVARPVNQAPRIARPDRSSAAKIFDQAFLTSARWATKHVHPLDWLDRSNPRPGLRRWLARFSRNSESAMWREAWAEVLDDGGVVLASAMGAGRAGANTTMEPHEIPSDRVETFVADFMALLMATSQASVPGHYDVQIEVRWDGPDPVIMRIPDTHLGGYYLDEEHSFPIRRFVPVRTVIDTSASEEVFVDHLREVALDVVNQGGVQYLHSILPSTDGQ